MNRRAFLALVASGVAGLTLDPERLLWVPRQKTIFDLWTPPRGFSSRFALGDLVTFDGVAGSYRVNALTASSVGFSRIGVVSELNPVKLIMYGPTVARFSGDIQWDGQHVPSIAAPDLWRES